MKKIIPIISGIRGIDTENIIYCEADGDYSKIYTNLLETIDKKKYFVATINLKNLEDLLQSTSFYRCHRSYFINLKYFHEFILKTNSIHLTNGTVVKISKRKKIEFKNRLLEYSKDKPLTEKINH